MSWPPVCCKMNERKKRREEEEGKGGREGQMGREESEDDCCWWAAGRTQFTFSSDPHLNLSQHNRKYYSKSYLFFPKYRPERFGGVKGGKGKPEIKGGGCREGNEHWHVLKSHFNHSRFITCPTWSLGPSGPSTKVQDQDCVCQISKPKTWFSVFC